MTSKKKTVYFIENENVAFHQKSIYTSDIMENISTNRLSKVLAAAGVASRRKCEQLIFEGKVQVNGEVILAPQTMVSLEKDVIIVAGKRISGSEKKVHFVLNKPKGYLCSHKKGNAQRVIDLFKGLPYRLFTAGRLDCDTTGLIIVTNDGQFAQEVIHPSKGIEKEYLVKVDQEVFEDDLKAIAEGMVIEGRFVKPIKVKKVRRGTLKIVVGEGKKHEVRLLVSKIGRKVLSLTRIRIGGLTLGTLAEGEYRELSEKERRAIFH